MIPQFTPMAPTLVRAAFHRPGWVYEEKVDGYRMLAYKERAAVRLVSRTGVDHTRRYPDVAVVIALLATSTLVLDGELAMFDEWYDRDFGGHVAGGAPSATACPHGGAPTAPRGIATPLLCLCFARSVEHHRRTSGDGSISEAC